MDSKPKFFVTDVFGDKKYSGNQLATFIDCAPFSDEEMQQIAREINFSETTFVISNNPIEGGYEVRIFTPGSEIDFAGHPTLGTAYIIQKHIVKQPVEKIVLNLKVGQVPVLFPTEQGNNEILWMQQVKPIFGETLDATFIASVLSLTERDIDTHWPIEQVSTGLPFIIVPLKNLAALKRASVVKELYQELVGTSWAKAILVFSPEGYTKEQSISVRVFVDFYGIPEDPASGSGNGCLAGYLIKNRYFTSTSIDIKTGQGYEIGRPSVLSLRATEQNDNISISVGGQVIPIAEGYWGS